MDLLDIDKYSDYSQFLPHEGSPDNTIAGTKACSDRFAAHAIEGLLHLRRLRGI